MTFTHRLLFRSKLEPTKALSVLEDTQGWLWVEKLIGTEDFTYSKSEIGFVYDVEVPETRRTALDSGGTGQSSSKLPT